MAKHPNRDLDNLVLTRVCALKPNISATLLETVRKQGPRHQEHLRPLCILLLRTKGDPLLSSEAGFRRLNRSDRNKAHGGRAQPPAEGAGQLWCFTTQLDS